MAMFRYAFICQLFLFICAKLNELPHYLPFQVVKSFVHSLRYSSIDCCRLSATRLKLLL